MSSIAEIITEFIAEHELDDEIYDPITKMFAKCMEAHALWILKEKIPSLSGGVAKEKKESNKATKDDKLEDPADAETRDDLRRCNTTTLTEYCKTNGLKVGGKKPDIMDRVWRHTQGDSSDDDLSPKSKPKKEKVAAEKHVCFGKNAKGAPCSISAGEQVDGCWFCFRHIKDATEIIAKSVAPVETKSKKSKETESKKKKVSTPLVTDDEEELTEEQKAAAARKVAREAARAKKAAEKEEVSEED